MIHKGACHCGALSIVFTSEQPLAPRACQCSFCRKHAARTVSDPGGLAEIARAGQAIRYRFGTRTTDYLICATCGVYVGAVAEIGGSVFATLNLNAFGDPRLDLAAEPVNYDGENAAERAERRRARWTPATLLP